MKTQGTQELSNPLETYQAILKQVEVALKELGKAEAMFADVEGMYQHHPLASSFLKLEERVHTLTHENASAIGLELEDVRRQLKRLEVMLGFPEFTQAQFEMIERSAWSVALVQEIHQSMSEQKTMTQGEVSKRIKELQGRL